MEKQYRDAFSSPLHTAVIAYTYDSMNRLVSENCGDSRISYKYDLSGNRISRVTDGRTENYLYNSRNQLTQLTGDDKNISYTYDPAGNLTEEHSTEHKKIYFYDTYNRNTEITGNDFTQKNHYDAEGYRYSIEENDKVTDFVYRRGIMLAELDEAGNQAKTYTLGNEYAGHVSELNNSLDEYKDASYYITDEQGSIRYILDQSGEVQNYYQYSAFGETIISEETTSNRLRYNAQTEDELTGLYYLRARYYAPGIGRFTQEDVIYNDGLNLYAYCNSNPVMYSAPSGFAKETCKSKVGGECGSESGSTTYKNSSDITKDIRKNKPLNSPAVDSWYGKNGTISIDENGVWTYHDWEGNSVSYPNGYPNFKSADMVRQEAPIGPFVERSKDFAKAREMGYIKSADGTWHHHEDGVTLQEVETILHDRFRHRGGISNLKKK